ncbi:MAG: hypothetical protein KDA90_20870 [Planctomycetaceae bacterium]|nr:hypothetical protein [Planctomycetaceae bacterium]
MKKLLAMALLSAAAGGLYFSGAVSSGPRGADNVAQLIQQVNDLPEDIKTKVDTASVLEMAQLFQTLKSSPAP